MGPTQYARRVSWSATTVCQLCFAMCLGAVPARCDGLLLDPGFETVGQEGSAWALRPEGAAEADTSALHLTADDDYAMAWQDLRGCTLEPGAVVRAAVVARLERLASGRGAWLALHFYDAFDNRLGDATSGVLASTAGPERLSVVSCVPDRCRRATVVLVVHGKAEAVFSKPEASCEGTPPRRYYDGARCVVSDRSEARTWIGLGIATDAEDARRLGTAGAIAPSVLWLRLRWRALREAEHVLRPWLRLAEDLDATVGVALTGGTDAPFADPTRVAVAAGRLAARLRDLPERPALLWVCPADMPDVDSAVSADALQEVLRELPARLPDGVSVSGPAEWFGVTWSAALAPSLGPTGGLVTCHLNLDRRDSCLYGDALSARVRAGARAGIVSIGSQHPDDRAYEGSLDRALDTACLLLQAAAAGYDLPMIEAPDETDPLATVLAGLAPGLAPRPRVRAIRVEPEQSLVAIWVEDSEAAGRMLAVANRGADALRFELVAPAGTRDLRLGRTALRARDGFASRLSEVWVRAGRLADVVESRAVVVYAERRRAS